MMGFLLGMLVGATVGIFIASLCVAASRGDERSRMLEQRRAPSEVSR